MHPFQYGQPVMPMHAVLQPTVPVRVQSAMACVQMFNGMCHVSATFDGGRPSRRTMTPGEAATYEAALMVLRYYFTGEMEYEEMPQVISLANGPQPKAATDE